MELKYNEDGSPYTMWGGKKVQIEKQPVKDKFYLDKAENELRETPENVEKALRELRELLKGEPTLYVPLEDDEFLIKFLRPCKFYAESAFKKIKLFYKFKQNHKEYCVDLVPSKAGVSIQHLTIGVSAPRDQHGRRIYFVRSGEAWNPRLVPLKETFRDSQIALNAISEEPMTQINGVIAIMDFKGLSFSQIMEFTPSFAKMFLTFVQDCLPVRLKAVHIVNQPMIFNVLFAVFKPFMQQKLRSRIFFHGSNRESLLAHIDGGALRERHGGSLPDSEESGEVLWKLLCHYDEEFKVSNLYGYNDNNNNNKINK